MKFRIAILFYIMLIATLLTSCSTGVNQEQSKIINIENIDQLFKGYDGCFILFDQKSNQYQIYNEVRLDDRISPCSTFKIVNSLIGLESGVVQDKNSKYSWDGKAHRIESWNKDHTLESAIANSVVWYYQRLAKEVGEERMQHYIDLLDYGNKDISGGITQFWLESSLQISPREELKLLIDLYNDDLPFEKEHMQIVRDILVLKETDEYIFSGKTGTGDNKNGWFVGTLQRDDNIYYFVTNILAKKQATGNKSKEITIEILKTLELY